MTEIPIQLGEKKMKFLVIDEMSKEDFTRIMAADATQIHGTEREKGKLPPHVFPDHFLHRDVL